MKIAQVFAIEDQDQVKEPQIFISKVIAIVFCEIALLVS